MASVTKGHRPVLWRAYYYDAVDKKQKFLPREVNQTLDGMSKEEALQVLDRWLADNGIKALRSRYRSLFSDDEATGFIRAYIEERTALGTAEFEAIQAIESNLRMYGLKYFVGVHGVKNVRQWWEYTVGFSAWLRSTHPSQTVETSRKIALNLRKFGEYLAEQRIISQPWLVKLPSRKRGQVAQTPLPRAIEPIEVLSAAAKLQETHPTWALVMLCGYFASLRTEETLGLGLSDFLTGDRAKQDSKTYKRFAERGLGSGLAISISKARSRKGQRPILKTSHSFGVVNVWSTEGARQIARHLKATPPGLLFDESIKRQVLDEQWLETGYKLIGMSLYDLRRASCLYLARTLGIEPFLLQDHMRHATLATTLLYTRRPAHEKETAESQNFDDVG